MPVVPVNDVNIHYRIHGGGEGEPIVFIHGLGSSGNEWMYQLPDFEPAYKVITLSLRGHGESDKPEGPHSIKQYARDVAGLLEQLGIERCALLGFSLGGAVAYQMAVDNPHSATKLVVVNSLASFELDHWRKYFAVFMRVGMTKLFGMQRMARFAAKRMFPAPDQAHLRHRMISRHKDNDRASYLAALNALVGWSVRDQLSSIQLPTLIVASENDFITLGDKRIDADQIPNARIAFIPDSHHGPQFDQSELFNEIVLDFLGS